MEALISILVVLVVLGLLFYLASLLPLPAPFPLLIQVVFIIIAILVILRAFSGYLPALRI